MGRLRCLYPDHGSLHGQKRPDDRRRRIENLFLRPTAGPGPVSFGRIVESPESILHNMNEEHGYVDNRAATREFAVGDRVRIIPNHVCVAVNLHEQVYGVRNEQVEAVWKVEGRGKLQ